MAFFLPINSTSLAHYFVCACVKPACFFDNKPNDLQDRFRNSLLVSTELGTKDTDCCIELVLTNIEEKLLIPCGKNFYLLNKPLPISRIRKVYFKDRRQLELTLSNINMSAAFIPNSLAEVTTFSDIEFSDENSAYKQAGNDYSRQIELFDRILGALALMKTARESYMNYSENYASTLSLFNSLIKSDLVKQGCQINDKFFGLFSRTGSFVKYIPYLEKSISNEDLEQIAYDNKQIIKRSFTKTIDYEKLSGMTYAFAVLQSYGVGNEAASIKVDSLITSNFANIKNGMAEGIALYYGYNRGYSVFNNSYGTEEAQKQRVKFVLDSKLDYYTIESVYQFVFNPEIISSRFPYIDEWCPQKQEYPARKTDFKVLDTVFIGKKKPSVFSKEYLQGVLAEIKTLDLLNLTLEAIIGKIRLKVADDTREEVEDLANDQIAIIKKEYSDKYSKFYLEVESLRKEVELKNLIINDLHNQNNELVKKIDLLKADCILNSTCPESKDILRQYEDTESDSVLKEPEQTSLFTKEQITIGVSKSINSSKKTKQTKSKSATTKRKTNQKSTKKQGKDILNETEDSLDFKDSFDSSTPEVEGDLPE